MTNLKHDRWNEEEVLALPKDEQDYFERKSGAIIAQNTFDEVLAKALSAFANSGGGHLILGVMNDGTIDGVPATYKGRISTKDWIEQKIPRLLSYPLQDFRVHEVEPASVTLIPKGRVVIVIDIGDSALAPHQVSKTHHYYCRHGGRSEPATHFFLELLWGRKNRFPGKKIARVWLNTIGAALALVNQQRQNLDDARRSWDREARRDLWLKLLASEFLISSPNAEQMYEFYPELVAPMARHDEEVRAVWSQMQELHDALVEQKLSIDRVYREVMAPEMREQLYEQVGHRSKSVANSSSEEDLTNALFGSHDRYEVLAALIVGHSGELGNEPVAPLWNLHHEKFMAILAVPAYAPLEKWILRIRFQLRDTAVDLGALLEVKRHELATKFGEPYIES